MSQTIATLLGQLVIFAGLGISAYTLKRSIKKDRDAKLISDAFLSKTVEVLDTNVKALSTHITKVETKLEKETGDNNDGLRQKLNEHSEYMKEEIKRVRETQLRIDEKTDLISNGLAKLEGAFAEHRLAHERAG